MSFLDNKQDAIAWHGRSDNRRTAEIFFSAKFSLPEKKLPFPALIFEGQLKTRHAPGTSVAPYPIPVLAAPKRILAAFERLRSKIRTYPDAQRAHIGTKDALNNEVKLAFGQGDLSWKPGHLRSAYGAICCHRFKPKNMTDDIRDPRPQTLAGRPSAVRWFNINDPPGDLVILTMRISRLELCLLCSCAAVNQLRWLRANLWHPPHVQRPAMRRSMALQTASFPSK
jgi:hypothetical protein